MAPLKSTRELQTCEPDQRWAAPACTDRSRTGTSYATASLDFGNQVKVLGQVKQLAARGLEVVLSTHDPDHAFATATRVLLLHDKGLIADGPPGEVLTPKKIAQCLRRIGFDRTACGGRYCLRAGICRLKRRVLGVSALFGLPRLLGDVVAGTEAIVAQDLLGIGTEDKRGRVVGTSGGTPHDDDPVSMAGHGMPS